MVGHGPDLMRRALEAVGVRLKPASVALCMCTENSRRVRSCYAGTGFLIPRYRLESAPLRTVPYPEPDLWDGLSVFAAARKISWNCTRWHRDLKQALQGRFEELADDQPFQKAIVFLPGTGGTPASNSGPGSGNV